MEKNNWWLKNTVIDDPTSYGISLTVWFLYIDRRLLYPISSSVACVCVCVPASYCFILMMMMRWLLASVLLWFGVGGRAGTWSIVSIILSSKWKWMNLFELTHMLTDQSYEKSICSTYSAVVDSSSRRQVLKSREVDDFCCSRGYCHVYQKWKGVKDLCLIL